MDNLQRHAEHLWKTYGEKPFSEAARPFPTDAAKEALNNAARHARDALGFRGVGTPEAAWDTAVQFVTGLVGSDGMASAEVVRGRMVQSAGTVLGSVRVATVIAALRDVLSAVWNAAIRVAGALVNRLHWCRDYPLLTTYLASFSLIYVVFLRPLGFNRGGIARNSWASNTQSAYYGGSTPRGGWFAGLTSLTMGAVGPRALIAGVLAGGVTVAAWRVGLGKV